MSKFVNTAEPVNFKQETENTMAEMSAAQNVAQAPAVNASGASDPEAKGANEPAASDSGMTDMAVGLEIAASAIGAPAIVTVGAIVLEQVMSSFKDKAKDRQKTFGAFIIKDDDKKARQKANQKSKKPKKGMFGKFTAGYELSKKQDDGLSADVALAGMSVTDSGYKGIAANSNLAKIPNVDHFKAYLGQLNEAERKGPEQVQGAMTTSRRMEAELNAGSEAAEQKIKAAAPKVQASMTMGMPS